MANLIYITYVEPEGPYIKVWGQCERNIPVAIEKTLLKLTPRFDCGENLPTTESFQVGALCCAKFKDGAYYRARIVSTVYMAQGVVEVLFIDYGNKDFIPYINIRALNDIPVGIISIPAQAQEFILANVSHQDPTGWDTGTLEFISNEIRYLDLHFQPVGQVGPFNIISLYNNNQDLSINFLNRGCIASVPVPMQQLVLQAIIGKAPPTRAPVIMPQQMVPTPPPLQSPPFVPTLLSYKSLPLEMGSDHPVYISYVTDGPCLFSVQLKKLEDKLREIMEHINFMQLLPLEEPPLPGTVCVARSCEDNYICRAVVTSMVDCNFKVFYVDFGNTELLPFTKLYQIPFKYVIPKVMANRFTLAGLNNSAVSIDMKCAFKKFVDNELLFMRVKTPATGTALASCELWNSTGVDALQYVQSVALQSYPQAVALTRGPSVEVKVSFVYGCNRFYIQLKNKESELNAMMEKLQDVCIKSPSIKQTSIQINMPCNALYEGDGKFYRAQIIELKDENIKVRYVDYGNEEMVNQQNIKSANSDLITILRPQAIECCLNGYQNMEVDEERDNLLEELILEQDFMMKVSEIQSGKALVELFNNEHYNVASLLLEKIAVTKSQVSPMLVQENSQIEHRKRTPPASNTFSREKEKTIFYKARSWRDKKNQNDADSDKPAWRDNRPQRNESEPERTERTYFKRPDSNRNRNDNEHASKPNNTDFKPRYNRNDNDNARTNNDTARSNNADFKPRSNRNDNAGSFQTTNSDRTYDNKQDFKRKDSRSEEYNSKPSYKRNDRSEEFSGKSDFNRKSRDRDGSEKSWSGSEQNYKNKDRDGGGRSEYKPKYNKNTDHSNAEDQAFDVPLDLAPADASFSASDCVGTTENVSISWFHNPTNFYVQQANIKDSEFGTIMKDLQKDKKKLKPCKPEVGAAVIALYPADGVLYRAVITEAQSSQYRVFYVDFGNTSIVQQVYPIEKKYIELPAQATRCSLVGIKPNGDNWPAGKDIDKFFEKDMYECAFISCEDSIYSVELKCNNKIVKDELIAAKLALDDVPVNPNANFDVSMLLGQQIMCHIAFINNLSDLMLQLQPGLFVRCGLHNVDKATEKWEENLHPWLGHFVIIYVDDVIEDRLEITLYDTHGLKLKLIEPDEDAFETVEPLCAMPVLSPYIQGYVSHATPTTIFVQPTALTDNVSILLERLFQHYDTAAAEPIELEEDIIYAVHSVDGNWYRGKAKLIEEDNITVEYIDYGNTESVAKTELRMLDEIFNETHMLAIEIIIADSESLLDQEVDVTIAYTEFGWEGTLKSNEIAVVEDKASEIVTVESEIVMVESETVGQEPIIPQIPEEAGTTNCPLIGFSVILSHSDNPSQFFLQLADDEETINNLQQALQLEVPNLPDMDTVTAGVLCAAPYSADGEWYRAQVLDADSEYVSVRFVDYGNTDTVMDSTTKLKTLPAELLALEQHARKCSLCVQPNGEEWSTEACEKFDELIDVENLSAEIVHQDEKTTFVDLYANGINIAEILLAENFAAVLALLTESSCTGFISHTNSPSEFWIQLESACSDLEKVADQLVSAEGYPELAELAPGALCAAIFPEDESWYRARILSNTVAGLEVLFIDYGNSCTSTSLRELPEDLVMLPALAQKCSLQKPTGILQWPKSSTDTFKELANDGAAVFTVKKLSPGETSVVQLLLENEDICLKFIPETVDAVITNFVSVDSFYVQKVENIEKLDEISKKLLKSPDWPAFEPSDKLVSALSLEYGKWYRAELIGVAGVKTEVVAIDYGHHFTTEDMRKLMEGTDIEEPLVDSCTLEPLPGFKFADGTDQILKGMINDGQTVFQVEFVHGHDVRLFRFGIDVRNNLDTIKYTPVSSVNSTPKKQFKLPEMTNNLSLNFQAPYSPIPDRSYAKLLTSGDVTMFSDYEKCNNSIDKKEPSVLCEPEQNKIDIEVIPEEEANNTDNSQELLGSMEDEILEVEESAHEEIIIIKETLESEDANEVEVIFTETQDQTELIKKNQMEEENKEVVELSPEKKNNEVEAENKEVAGLSPEKKNNEMEEENEEVGGLSPEKNNKVEEQNKEVFGLSPERRSNEIKENKEVGGLSPEKKNNKMEEENKEVGGLSPKISKDNDSEILPIEVNIEQSIIEASHLDLEEDNVALIPPEVDAILSKDDCLNTNTPIEEKITNTPIDNKITNTPIEEEIDEIEIALKEIDLAITAEESSDEAIEIDEAQSTDVTLPGCDSAAKPEPIHENQIGAIRLTTFAEEKAILYNNFAETAKVEIPKYTTPIETADSNDLVPRNTLNLLEELQAGTSNGVNTTTETIKTEKLEESIKSGDTLTVILREGDLVKKEIDKNVTV